MSHNFKNGRDIKFSYNAAPTTASKAVGIYDSDDNAVTLQPFERLIVDVIAATADTNSDAAATGVITVFAGNAGDSATTAKNVLLIVGADGFAASEVFQGTHAGLTLPLGVGLAVVGGDSTVVARITGTGRIVIGQSQGSRPAWREALSPGQPLPTGVVDP